MRWGALGVSVLAGALVLIASNPKDEKKEHARVSAPFLYNQNDNSEREYFLSLPPTNVQDAVRIARTQSLVHWAVANGARFDAKIGTDDAGGNL
jgi:hypothetical protein